MSRLINPIGSIFYNWKVDSFDSVKYKKKHYKCICINCSIEKTFCATELKQGKIASCIKCNPKSQTLKEGFEKFVVKKEGCWDWNGCAPKNPGYGQFRHGMKRERAHRASWVIHFGEIPKGSFVLHKCDNKICSNPEHLFLGTQYDNLQDMISKNRHTSFKTKGRISMSLEKIKEIKELIKLNISPYKIAKMFNACHTVIYKIKNNEVRGVF